MILIWSYHFLADEQYPNLFPELRARVGTCLLSCGSSGQKEKASRVTCDENWTCTEPASKIFCQGLMKAVLTLWAERSWESCRQRALGRPVIAPRAGRKRFLPASQIWWLPKPGTNSLGPGRWPLVVCLGAVNLLASPGELCGRGWSQLGGVHSGGIWGGNGPAAGALIGLRAVSRELARSGCHPARG